MSTDGVKIIDGDSAHDTYWGIMDLYDNGADLHTIKREFPLVQTEYFDDFDNEIYVTACALALWEIGQITENDLVFIKSILEKGASVEEWTATSESYGSARQKELDKFWKKISKPNERIRKRRKYRKITNLCFQPDDLLAFRLKNGNYCAIICYDINQSRGNCNYKFVPTTYNLAQKPTIQKLETIEILGRRIGSGYNKPSQDRQPGIERVWNFAGISDFYFGLTTIAITHRDLIKFKAEFEKVGTLKIVEGLKQLESLRYYSSFEEFEQFFDYIEDEIRTSEYEKFPATVLCDL